MSEWIAVQKKSYNVGIAKAEVGMAVFNGLEKVYQENEADIKTAKAMYEDELPILKKRPYLTAEEVANLPNDLQEHIKRDAHIARENEVVICGTIGELWISKIVVAIRTYAGVDWDNLDHNFQIAYTSPTSNKVEVRPALDGEIITTNWGAKLVASEGDYISAYNEAHTDMVIINGKVFKATYEPYGTERNNTKPTNIVPLPVKSLKG